jgi:hypothetical protein
MTALLSGADYTTATGATVPDLVLAMASGVVRSYCGWSISQENDVSVTLDSDGGFFLFLPSLLVTDVASVTLEGTDDAGEPFPVLTDAQWDWRTNGRLTWLKDRCGWPLGGQRVTVVYSGGYAPVPPEVQGVVMALSERIAVSGVFQSRLENVGGIQTNSTYSQAVTGGIGLLPLEEAVLDRYRIGVAS